jgi:hypothetical protein
MAGLDRYRSVALYFTMAAAILSGIAWGAFSILDKSSGTSDAIGSVLIGATMLGGIVMGLLYAVHLTTKK